MDELLNSADERPLVEQLDEHLDDVALHNEYRRLVAEQTALRRLGTLVACGVEPSEVGRADAFTAGIWRFEPNGEVTLVAAAAVPTALAKWPVGTRVSIEANTLARVVSMWMAVEYTDTEAALYRTTTPEIAARATMRCGAVEVDRATTPSWMKQIRSFIDEVNP